ncbi:hypothetical protein AAFC00_003914 [Neodothiora populina]
MGIRNHFLFALVGPLCVAAWKNPFSVVKRAGDCPGIWSTISSQLTTVFLGADGQCTDLARAAIRFAFHDSGAYSSTLPSYEPASGGADGSLLLSPDEISRSENNGLESYHDWLTGFYADYSSQVSAADLIQFAASHATVTCPGGPQVRTVVGRTDTDTAGPEGQLPQPFGAGAAYDTLFQLFTNKGFSTVDLAALIGAHSTSKAFAQTANGIPSGGSQDSTPGKWDVDYYAQTYDPPSNVYRFDSDVNLSNTSTTVGQAFSGFVNNQAKWAAAFTDAMARLSVLGIPTDTVDSFVDCTGALPSGSLRRDIRASPLNARLR